MIDQESKPPPRLDSSNFDEAILLVRRYQSKEFCEAIFLRGRDGWVQLTAFLDAYCGVDHFNLRLVRVDEDKVGSVFRNSAPMLYIEALGGFEGIDIEIGEFYGEYDNLIEIASATIRACGGSKVILQPDPDRWVADQFMLVR